MIDLDTTLFQHFLQVSIAQRVRQVPTDTGKNDVLFETMAFEVDHGGVRGAIRRVRSLPESNPRR